MSGYICIHIYIDDKTVCCYSRALHYDLAGFPYPCYALFELLPHYIQHPCVMIRQNPCLLFPFLVNHILSWTPRGTTCLPRGTAQIALLSIGIYFFFLAFLVSDRRNRLPHVTIGLRP